LVNDPVSGFVSLLFFLLGGESFNSPHITESFLSHSGTFSFLLLDNFLDPFLEAAVEEGEDQNGDYTADCRQSQLPGNVEEKHEGSYDEEERSDEHRDVCGEAVLNNSRVRIKPGN